ncbi:T-cell immunoreceptor with Ig and ITIM domains-like isoform X1 [Heterodontus francisci]|uniref:T-cell immunoreceptor with Ig and ITIM domains-like isoform X1 n=1 Tax=Heterodontus francisci TaxID=7792 RepID=UPI00355B7B69
MFWLLAVMKMLIDFAICMLFVSGVQTIELKTSGNVTIVKGGSVTLRCDSSDKGVKMVLVEWQKSSNKTKLAVYSKQPNGTNLKNQRITMDVVEQHSTITIKEALKSDKGWYSCIFHTYPNGKQEGKIYLDVRGANIATMNHLHMRNLSIYLSVSIVGAAVVIMIVALVIWKMKRKPPASELDRKPHKNMPLYENVHNVPNTECHRNSDTSTSIYENVDNK